MVRFLTAFLLLAAPALAQPAPISRVVGVVAKLDGTLLTVKPPQGPEVAITLPADVRITALENRKLSDIKPGDFVGSAAMKGMDGKLHAQEVHIFPEALRGSGEGHRPMEKPDQTMTNATVGQVSAAAAGDVLTLNYAGGSQQIAVGPDARIVTFVAGDRALLKPGAAVSVTAVKAADGTMMARGVQAEKDGVLPLVF